METYRRRVRRDDRYGWARILRFADLDLDKPLTEPVSGTFEIEFLDQVTYPVDIGLQPIAHHEMRDAGYVDSSERRVDNSESEPHTFDFAVGASDGCYNGVKWVFYRTAEYDGDPDVMPKEHPECSRHHSPIPSAQKIRLCHEILAGRGTERTVQSIIDFYNEGRYDSTYQLYDDAKGFLDFPSLMGVLNFIIHHTNHSRSISGGANIVRKQIRHEQYRHRTQSLADVKQMTRIINSLDHLPLVSTENVYGALVKKADEEEQKQIANRWGLERLSDMK